MSIMKKPQLTPVVLVTGKQETTFDLEKQVQNENKNQIWKL